MTNRYPYVHVHVPAADAELVSVELFELGAQGVEERDCRTLTKGDADAPELTLVASFEDEHVAQRVRDAFAPRYVTRIEVLEGDGWRDGWKAYWKPTRIGRRLVVRPSWESYAPEPEDVVLTLDPGSAFGTGSHETTRLVLEQLEAHVRPGYEVLDAGTGSGILAIACALLGAASVRAVDVDPEAVRACHENAEANRVAAVVRAEQVGPEPAAIADGRRYPLVLANIETRILVPMKQALIGAVASGGTLVLGGILRPELDEVRAAFLTSGELKEAGASELGEWAALVLERAP